MAWFARYTRFGDMHWVYGQERGMSCGLASTTMLVFKVNKLVPGATAIRDEEQITKAYERFVGSPYDVSNGTFPEDLVGTLDSLTKKKWMNEYLTGPALTKKMIETVGVTAAPGPIVRVNPIILGVNWQGGGAHWLVVDTVRKFMGKLYATVCDPWDGDVHVTTVSIGDTFEYTAQPNKSSWSLRGAAGQAEKVLGSGSKFGQQLDRIFGKRAFAYDAAPSYGASTEWGIVYST